MRYTAWRRGCTAMTLPPGMNDRGDLGAGGGVSVVAVAADAVVHDDPAAAHGFILGYGSSLPAQIPRAVRLMRSVISGA